VLKPRPPTESAAPVIWEHQTRQLIGMIWSFVSWNCQGHDPLASSLSITSSQRKQVDRPIRNTELSTVHHTCSRHVYRRTFLSLHVDNDRYVSLSADDVCWDVFKLWEFMKSYHFTTERTQVKRLWCITPRTLSSITLHWSYLERLKYKTAKPLCTLCTYEFYNK